VILAVDGSPPWHLKAAVATGVSASADEDSGAVTQRTASVHLLPFYRFQSQALYLTT
jgi:hypothetical protein